MKDQHCFDILHAISLNKSADTELMNSSGVYVLYKDALFGLPDHGTGTGTDPELGQTLPDQC